MKKIILRFVLFAVLILFVLAACFVFITVQFGGMGQQARKMAAYCMAFESVDGELSDFCFLPPDFNTEEYKTFDENRFITVAAAPLSTFGADVDTASYSNVRRMLMQQNRLPPKDAVRVEEFINYFTYDYPQPQGDALFSTTFEMAACPWNKDHKLLLIGVQGRNTPLEKLPPSNIVFLLDNSGSMSQEIRLLRESMSMLVKQLRPQDKVSIVTYGGDVRILLDSVSGSEQQKLQTTISQLVTAGFTPGGAGIVTAYELAARNFIKGGNNRVVLVTDGDFNVGVSSESELITLIEEKRETGVYLTTIGMGTGNYKDNKMKMLANKGNGNYIYLDSQREARKFVNEFSSRMYILAKDVKFQLEFNPAQISAYRLIGYELRKLDDRDFNDDAKDSGEIGVGHQVTALYELVMANAPEAVKKAVIGDVDPLKYQTAATPVATDPSAELLTFKLRYQQPEGDAPSALLTFPLAAVPSATINWNWASAVAEFALLLRDSAFKGNASFEAVKTRAQQNLGSDPEGQRAEFLTLVSAAKSLKK